MHEYRASGVMSLSERANLMGKQTRLSLQTGVISME